MGKPRKPAALLMDSGAVAKNPQKYRERVRFEPKPEFLPEMPDNLGKYGEEFWNRMVPKLHRMGVLGDTDQDLLIQTARCIDELERNWRSGKRQSDQMFNRRIKLWQTFDKLAAKLGMSPVARTAIAVKPKDKDTATKRHIA